MHLKSLKIFCDVVDKHSFSRAAEVNGVSQSNASQVVHHLEDHLGVQLIDRSTRPFLLTPEGQRFHEGSRVIVQRYDDLVREVRSLHEVVAARFTVASIYSVGLAHMSRYLREFLAAYPQADVRLEYLHPHRVYDAVDSGQADLGLVSYPEESRSLATLPWRSERLVLVCHPQHRFARQESIPLASLHDEPLVAFQEGLKIREVIDFAMQQEEIIAKVTLEFDNIETIKRAIEINVGVSLLPEPTVTREVASGALAKVTIDGPALIRPLGIIHRRDRKLSDAAEQFVRLLQSRASDLSDPQAMPAAPAETPASQAVGIADDIADAHANGHAFQEGHRSSQAMNEPAVH